MTDLTNYQPPALVPTDPTGGRLIAWADAASAANSLARALATTAFVPATMRNPGDATAAILMGDELGLTPLAALRSIYVVHGAPALYARTMVALAQSRGHQVWTETSSDQSVTVCGQRRGSTHVEKSTWTLARATKAGYTGNKKYASNPQEMLYSKAAAEVCRKIAADVLAAVPYTVEDIELAEPATVTVVREPGPRTVKRRAPEPVEPELPEPVVEPEPEPATRTQVTRLNIAMKELGIEDRESKLAWLSSHIGRRIESSNDLTRDEASRVIDTITAPEPTEQD